MDDKSISVSLRGSALVVMGSLSTVALQFISVLVLSRLISPEDFGLIAMVGVFVAFGNLIRDFGLPMAVLQRESLTPQQSSNAFWMNAGMAFLTGSLLAILTPFIVAFYSEPRLMEIVPTMAVTIILAGVGAQLQVQLARSMRYGILVLTDIVSQVSGLIIACALAFGGAGYWALIAQYLTAAVVLLIARWTATMWVPMRFRRGHGSLSIFRSGAQYGAAYFLGFLQNNADTLTIGVTLGAGPLGIYNRAYQLLTAPAGGLLAPLANVVIPTINKIKQDGGSYTLFLLKAQFAVGVSMALIFGISAGAAEVLIPFLLGPGWEEAIPVFQIFAIGGIFSALSNVSYWGFIANQQSKQLMYYNFLTKPLVICLIIAGSFYGLVGIASGLAVGLAISWPINLVWLNKTAKFESWSFFRNGMWIFVCGVFSAIGTKVTILNLMVHSALLSLAVAGFVGLTIFLLTLCISRSSRQILMEFVLIARSVARRDR